MEYCFTFQSYVDDLTYMLLYIGPHTISQALNSTVIALLFTRRYIVIPYLCLQFHIAVIIFPAHLLYR